MKELGILEPIRVPKEALASATGAAVTILRIDDVIAAKAEGKRRGGPESSPDFD